MFSLGRLTRSIHVQIKILSKPDCCLCDQAYFAVSRLVKNLGPNASAISIEMVNIETDPELMNEYSLTIPVVMIDGGVVSESRIDTPALRKYLEDRLGTYKVNFLGHIIKSIKHALMSSDLKNSMHQVYISLIIYARV